MLRIQINQKQHIDLMETREIADAVGISESAVVRQIRDKKLIGGQLTYSKVYLVNERDFIAWRKRRELFRTYGKMLKEANDSRRNNH